MQYVRKGDGVQPGYVGENYGVSSVNSFFFIIFIYIYISNIRDIYICIIHYHLSFFFFSFLFRKTTITKVRTLVLCFIGTYMYRRNLSIYLFIVLYIRSVALNYSLRLNRMRQK